MSDDIDIGIGVHAEASDLALVDRFSAKIAGLRAELAKGFPAAGTAALAGQVNVAIGAFERMGKTVDVTNAKAVAAFRAEGDALSVYLVKLGATDAELNKIGTTIAALERRSGAAAIVPPVSPGTLQSYEKIPTRARTAANALSQLSIAAATGGGSLQGMTIAAGSAASGILSMSKNAAIAASASGIGALITLLGVLVAVLAKTEQQTNSTNVAITNLGNLRTDQIQTRLAATEKEIDEQTKKVNAFSRARLAAEAPFEAFGLGEGDATRAQNRLDNLIKQREAFTKDLIEANKREQDQLRQQERTADNEAARLFVERTQGEVAARRLAAQQEFKDRRDEITRTVGDEGTRTRLIAAERNKLTQTLATIAHAQAESVLKVEQDAATERLRIQAKGVRDEFNQQRANAIIGAQVDKEAIEKRVRDHEITAEQGRQQTINRENALGAELVDIEEKRALKIEEINRSANAKLLELQGRTGEGRAEAIRAQYAKDIATLTATINATGTSDAEKAAARRGLAIINALIPVEQAAGRLSELDTLIAGASERAQTKLEEVHSLQQAHAITDAEARKRILAVYQAERNTLAATIPLLQAQADAIGSEKALAAVDRAKAKLVELDFTIRRVVDRFGEIKVALRDSTENALSGLFTDAFKLLGRNTPELDALKAQLAGAEHELETLLAGPPTAQAGERIRQVRDEITELRVRIDDSKRSIETWKDALVNAAGVIVSALEEVLAKMAAVAIIQNVMGLFGGHGPSTADISADVTRLATSRGFASGGQVRGPAGRDVIPAWLTDEEYVISATRVRQFGKGFFDLINFAGQLPPIVTPNQLRRGYAEGGLVRGGVGASSSVPIDDRLRLLVEAHPDAIVRVLESPRGAQVVMRIIAERRKETRLNLGI